jgi:hypothetical protein
MVAIQKVGANPQVIPTPTEPSMADESPSAYVPSGMSTADRQELREAGIEWTSTLGGGLGQLGAWYKNWEQASLNMRHFRTGNGADRRLGSGFVDNMPAQSRELTTFQNVRLKKFLELIRDDLSGQATGSVGQYLLFNNEGGRNGGTNWYGLYANNGTALYFTVGGFFVSYGAVGVRARSTVNISYKMFVWDRYNWDTNKETTIPGNQLSWLLNDGEMEDIAGMKAPGVNSADYFRRIEDEDGNISYVVNDALMGALVDSGDAKNFDIVGAGNVQTASFPVAANPLPTTTTDAAPTSPPARPRRSN